MKGQHSKRASAPIEALESRTLFTSLPPGFGEALVASGMSSPTAMEFSPDGRLFVLEQGGNVRIIKNGALLSQPFLTVAVTTSGEYGLGGITFDPDFENNQHVYVYYTATTPNIHNRVSRFTANGDVVVAGSEVVLLDLPGGGASIHNGGALRFADDGHLLIAVGDHGGSTNGQDMSKPFGKILRIEPDGTIPQDNPFYSTTTGVNRAIWALGLRNPFTTAVEPGTGRLFINDVGQALYEEINVATGGENFGWATTEGPFNQATYPQFTQPAYAYAHPTGYAVTGGTFYNPAVVQFPAGYAGQYFFADYVMGFVRTMDPLTHQVSAFATGLGQPVDLDVGPDGALYYLSRANNGVLKIVATSAPQISQQPQSQLVSYLQPVTLTVVASGQAPLVYQWRRDGVDIPGATGASYTIGSVENSENGAEFDVVVSNGQGSTESTVATLTVTFDQPPEPYITSPSGELYQGGQTITFGGYGWDPETEVLPPENMTWWVDFHHDTHSHPFMAPVSGMYSGSFDVPQVGETSANVWYRIHLRVTDFAGFPRETSYDLHPKTATVTLQPSVAGLGLSIDSQPKPTPIVIEGVAGMLRLVSAAELQVLGGVSYDFVNWSDGGMATHYIVFPETDTTYTANYQPFTKYYLSDLPWSGAPVGQTPKRDGNWFNGPISIDGVAYAKGLGTFPYSQVTYALGGAYERFVSDVGRDDAWGDAGRVSFEVYVDGIKRFDSGLMTGATPKQHIDLDVTGAQNLTLILNDGLNGVANDESDWGDAHLIASGASAPLAPSDVAVSSSQYNRVTITWKDHSSNEAGFKIERSTDGVNFIEVATAAVDAGSHVDAPVSAGTQFWYRVRAINAIGASAPVPAATTVTTAPSTLGPGWYEAQIGHLTGAQTGSAFYTSGTFTVRATGRGVVDELDELHYLYRTLNGDGQLIARVNYLQPLDSNTRIGVMIRESLDAGSRMAMMFVGTGTNSGWIRRAQSGTQPTTSTVGALATPRWIKIQRSGNSVTGWHSSNGVNWTLAGSISLPLGPSAYFGIAMSSGNSTLEATATVDNVAYTSVPPTLAAPASATPPTVTGVSTLLSVRGADDGPETDLIYSWAVLNKPGGASEPVFSANGSYAARDTTVTFDRSGQYQFRATIFDGMYSVTSDLWVTVAATLSGIAITPTPVVLPGGAQQQFGAIATDQFGRTLLNQPVFTWAVEGGGTISPTGLFTAPMSEMVSTITAQAGDVTAYASAIIDNVGPTAVLLPTPAPVALDSSWTFQVRYQAAVGIDVSTLDGAIIVTDPLGVQHTVTLLGITPSGNGSPRTATYRLDAPSGAFATPGTGIWIIALVNGHAKAVGGAAINGTSVGAFAIVTPFAWLADGTLHVDGTDADNALLLSQSGGDLLATLDGQTLSFDASSADDIVVSSFAGDDLLEIDSPIDQPITYLGEGVQRVNVTSGSAALLSGMGMRLASVNVADGATLKVNGNAAVLVEQLTLAATGRIDLGRAAMIARGSNLGTWTGTSYTGLTGLVASAFNGGAWDGAGIGSSIVPTEGGLTHLGVTSATDVLGLGASDTALWRGQTVFGSDVLLMYTYAGDMNLSGVVDVDDYGQIDFNVSIDGAWHGYYNGDLNYDGIQDVDDYGLIDFAFGIQGPPI